MKNVDASVCGKGVGAKVDDGLRRCGGFRRMMMCVGEEYSGGRVFLVLIVVSICKYMYVVEDFSHYTTIYLVVVVIIDHYNC